MPYAPRWLKPARAESLPLRPKLIKHGERADGREPVSPRFRPCAGIANPHCISGGEDCDDDDEDDCDGSDASEDDSQGDDDEEEVSSASDAESSGSDDSQGVSAADSSNDESPDDDLVPDYAGLYHPDRHCDRCDVYGHTNQYCPHLPAPKRRRV